MARRINRSKACKEDRRKACEARAAEWQELSPAQQMVALDERLGEGVGAVKQRTKLAVKIEAAKKEEGQDQREKETTTRRLKMN